MVSFKTLIASSIAVFAAFSSVEGTIAPSYPAPGTIQTSGSSYDTTWTFDGKNPTATYTIQFMTGSNDNQTVLATVATKVSASALKYTYTAPQVSPNSAIYFFMFTGSDGTTAWTTRFGITATADGTLTTEPNAVEPNGDKIPWGDGKLISSFSAAGSSASSAPIVTASASASSDVAVSSAVAASSSASPATNTASIVAAVASASSSVAPNASAASSKTSAASMMKPAALTFVVAATAGFFAL